MPPPEPADKLTERPSAPISSYPDFPIPESDSVVFLNTIFNIFSGMPLSPMKAPSGMPLSPMHLCRCWCHLEPTFRLVAKTRPFFHTSPNVCSLCRCRKWSTLRPPMLPPQPSWISLVLSLAPLVALLAST